MSDFELPKFKKNTVPVKMLKAGTTLKTIVTEKTTPLRHEYCNLKGAHANTRRFARKAGSKPINTRALDELLYTRFSK